MDVKQKFFFAFFRCCSSCRTWRSYFFFPTLQLKRKRQVKSSFARSKNMKLQEKKNVEKAKKHSKSAEKNWPSETKFY